MSPTSSNRQSGCDLSWFDSARGVSALATGQGALLPLLASCPGSHACLLLPTAAAAAAALTLPLPNQERLWHAQEGWAGVGRIASGPALPLATASVDLLLAAYVVTTLPEPLMRLAEIERVLAPGGTAFVLELDPRSVWRRHWRDGGIGAATLHRLLSWVRQGGLIPEATYGLRLEPAPGLLLQRDWRLLACLPQAAYVLRLGKGGPAAVAVGPAVLSLGVSGT